MFYYLNGTITVLDSNLAVVDCCGVGYACYTTGYTVSQLQVGKQHKLYTYCNIKEDAFDIFGFASKEELGYFNQLLCVSGVGPKAALAILSALTPDQFALAVMTSDEKALTRAQGVGKKMAQRIILELKDKLTEQVSNNDTTVIPAFSGSSSKLSEASAALAALGYSQTEIGIALKNVDVEHLSVEEIVRCGLRAMVMQ